MSETVAFDLSYNYNLLAVGIEIPVKLTYGAVEEGLPAKVDTGSTYCIFRRIHGEALGLVVEDGLKLEIGTATGSFTVYGHEVAISLLEISLESTVYFAESPLFDRNVLGRTGFLNRVKFGLIEPEGKVLLSRYIG